MRRKKTRINTQPEKVLSYEELFEQRFLNQNGRLFVVDVVKSRVLRALRELRTRQNISESLYVVKNSSIAREYAKVLYPGESVQIIDGVKSLCDALETCGLVTEQIADANLRAVAKKFKQTFPRVIVCCENNEGAVLHDALCPKSGLDGAFSVKGATDFCISDFLTECEYKFTLFDDVFDMFAFSATKPEDSSPARFERIVFKGEAYYTDIRHSYARLLRMADSCDQCVVLSDIVAKQNILSVYLALSLVHPTFSYRKAKAIVLENDENFATKCKNFYRDLRYCCGDRVILSSCLFKLQYIQQYAPSDNDSLSEYLKAQYGYLSLEELYLRAMSFQAEESSREILCRFENNMVIADAICEVFFHDDLKRVFENPESKLQHDWISSMDREEFHGLLATIEQLGGYIMDAPKTASFEFSRVYHEESGFEELLRRVSGDTLNRVNDVYTTARYSTDRNYRSISLKCLLETEGLQTPVLVLTDNPCEELYESLRDILPGVTCTADPLEMLERPESDTAFVLMDYEHFRSLAVDLPVKTVIFCDLLLDVGLMDRLIKKAQLLRSEGVVVRAMIDYRGIGGYIANTWEQVFKSNERKIIPIDLSEVNYGYNAHMNVREALYQLDSMHRTLGDLIEGRYKNDARTLSQIYIDLLRKYSSMNVNNTEKIHSDFAMFQSLAVPYDLLFSNSVSICGEGEYTYSQKPRDEDSSKKSRKKSHSQKGGLLETVEEEPRIIFNACVRQLFGTCDVTARNCASCELYEQLKINEYEGFVLGAGDFFKTAEKIISRTLNKRREERRNVVIITADNSVEELSGKLEKVKQFVERNETILESIRESCHDTLFFVGYNQIAQIRDMATETFLLFFKPYYDLLLSVFDQLSNCMKTALETSERGEAEKAPQANDRGT